MVKHVISGTATPLWATTLGALLLLHQALASGVPARRRRARS
jgi:hypothetical protein